MINLHFSLLGGIHKPRGQILEILTPPQLLWPSLFAYTKVPESDYSEKSQKT